MVFLCYEKCSTCKKARKWLDGRGAAYDVRPIKEQNPTEEELRRWQKMSGLPLKKFFNTSGQQYRALGLKDKLAAMDEDAQFALLASGAVQGRRGQQGGDDCVLEGFQEAAWAEKL